MVAMQGGNLCIRAFLRGIGSKRDISTRAGLSRGRLGGEGILDPLRGSEEQIARIQVCHAISDNGVNARAWTMNLWFYLRRLNLHLGCDGARGDRWSWSFGRGVVALAPQFLGESSTDTSNSGSFIIF
jgi:hypothetical protein